MAQIQFAKEQRDNIVQRIQNYFDSELDQDIGQFDAEFLLDFFIREIGPQFYNQALTDAQAVLQARMENIAEAIDELTLSAE